MTKDLEDLSMQLLNFRQHLDDAADILNDIPYAELRNVQTEINRALEEIITVETMLMKILNHKVFE